MNPYLSEKARGEIPRVLKWLRNAGLAFCVFCSFGGLYTLCLDLQAKDTSHVGGYVLWIVVGAVPLALFARGEARRYHARTIARRVENYSGPEVPLRWLLLCNISDIVPNTEVELYPSTGEELVFSPFLSGENGHVVEAEGVCDFTIYPEGDDWETATSPWSLEGNWLETARDTDEGYFDTAPEDADQMCFLPTDGETEGDQLPFTASYITPYPELNVEEADLFYQEGTPEVPFQTNQEWYATFTGEDGSRYAVTLEDENTLALKFYLDGEESYMSLVNTVYFARQEAMG